MDLHGHSRQRNAFTYGNNYRLSPELTRLFPYLLSRYESEIFKYPKCKFGATRDKESTARVVFWRMLKIPSVYTLETSLCGGDDPQMAHFSMENLEKLGRGVCRTILCYQNLRK